MSQLHTPGTMTFRENRDLSLDFFSGDRVIMCHARLDPANARRLAACWNACDGVETELLEQYPAPFTELRSQRDDLLEALRAFLRAPSVGSNGPGSITIVVQDFNMKAARDAIAKATGSAS